MDDDEVGAFLLASKTAVLSTLDRNGWPHAVAMWFVLADEHDRREIRMWTYRKSQKVKNLQRDDRSAFLAESGDGYADLRGVLVRGRIQILEHFDHVRAIGKALHERYVVPAVGASEDPSALAEIERQARKRVGLVLPLEQVASWDHRKLGSR